MSNEDTLAPQAALNRIQQAGGGSGITEEDLTDGTQKTQLVSSGGNVADVDSNGAVRLQSGGTPGVAVPNRATQVGGSDGTNLRIIKTDTSGNQLVKLTNGTQEADTIAGDSGQNALLVACARKEVSFTTTTVQAVASTDVSNYSWVSVHVVSQGGSSTITFQGSNDNTNWVQASLIRSSVTSGAAVTSTTSASEIYSGPLPFRYFRLNVTGIASGTTAGVIEFFASNKAIHTQGLSASQSGTWTVQPGNTANTTPWLTTDRGATPSIARVATSTTVATLQASNTARKELIIVNEAATVLYVKFGATATTTDYTVQIAAGGTYIEDKYTGVVTAILGAGSSNAQVTEIA